MHIKIKRAPLATALSQVIPAVSSKGTMDVIMNVKISAKDGKAVFVCTNLDITLSATAECEVIDEGSTTIPAKLFSAAINKMPEGDVDITSTKDDHTSIEAGTAKFKMVGIPATNFPEVPQVSGEEMVIPSKLLRDFIRKTVYALSADETRKLLSGMLLHFHDNGITAVGTDGRRLAKVDAANVVSTNETFELVLPRKTVDVLKAMLPKEGDVTVVRAASQVKFIFGTQEVTTRLFDGSYPNYNGVIPKERDIHITMPRSDLLTAIDRVSVFAKENGEGLAMGIEFKDGRAILTSDGNGADFAKDEVVVKYNGDVMSTKVNPNYLRDMLSALDDDEIEIGITDGASPLTFKPISADDFLYVLMPLRS